MGRECLWELWQERWWHVETWPGVQYGNVGYCYGRSLAPKHNRLTIFFLLLILSLLLTDKIPFSFMTATLPSHQACACPLPRAVHNFNITSVLCTSMLLISFTTCLMLIFHLSLRQCLLHGSAWCTPHMHASILLFHSATAVRLHHVSLLSHFMAMLDTCL